MPVAVKHIDEIKAELEAIKSKKRVTRIKRDKRDWHGLVYCDSNAWASIIGDNLEGIWLGRTDESIPYLKSRHIDGENVDIVLQTVRQFHSKEDPNPFERPRFFSMDGYVPSHFVPPFDYVPSRQLIRILLLQGPCSDYSFLAFRASFVYSLKSYHKQH